MASRRLPTVRNTTLSLGPGERDIPLDTAEWFAWLGGATSFSYQGAGGALTVRREQKGRQWYWYAYRTQGRQLQKHYLGRDAAVTSERLRALAAQMSGAGQPAAARAALFGTAAISLAGQPVALGAAKALGLLAYLAAHEQPQPREQLLALLWPDSAGEAARKNLRNLLWKVRAALGEDTVQGTTHLSLHERVWTDVRAFQQAAHAASAAQAAGRALASPHQIIRRLYRGPLLDGLSFGDAADFELWLVGAREFYFERYQQALAALVESARAAQRWAEVARIAREALASDPLQEPAHRALIEAHAHMGDRAAALRQYDALRDVLQRELGVAPLPETEQLRLDILSGDMPQAAPPAQPPQASPAPLIGRGAELAAMREAWQATAGRAQVVALQGEAGIGKSRLWQAWLAGLDARPALLAARCLPMTQHMPLAPAIGLLRAEPSRERLLAMASFTPPSWLADLARIMPELHAPAHPLPTPPALPPAEEQLRLFEALVLGLGLAPGQPAVLVVEDVHWADKATLDWLGYLTHRAQAMPLLVVITYRPEELPPALLGLVAAWSQAGLLRKIALGRLSRDETAALVASLVGDLSQVEQIYAQSDGNPYFISELAQAAPGDIPVALTDLIASRLAALSDEALQVIQAAAVLQPETDFFMIQQTSGCDDATLLRALDLLQAAGLLRDDGERYVFGHPLIAAVVERGLGSARRVLLHRRAAAAWERLEPAQLRLAAGRMAWHYREAGEGSRAARYAEQAGDQALALNANAEAAHFYQMAHELDPHPARIFGLGLARYRLSELDAARACFEAAVQGYEAQDDTRGAAMACLELARSFLGTGDVGKVQLWVQRGRQHLADEQDPVEQARAAYLLGASMRVSGGSLAEAASLLRRAYVLAQLGKAPQLLLDILLEQGNVAAQQGDLPLAIQFYRTLVAKGEAADEVLVRVIGHNNLAYHAMLLGDMATAHADIDAAFALVERHNLMLTRQWLYSTRGEIALAEGDWDAAEAWLRRGMVLAERYGNREHVATYHANLAMVARGRGDVARAATMLEEVRAEAEAGFFLAQVELRLAETHQLLGDAPATQAALARAAALLAGSEYGWLKAWLARLR
ncbi:AAA family ATPase [Chloroflexia bacterium SDU3-3]|nr:AAA family ATPase [Chloroflexia bacterium SDU3-3]